jgi:succinoglycan biosynthesis transport protein ExoP
VPLHEYVSVVRRRLGIVLGTLVAAAVVAGAASLLLEPTYSASTTLRTATGVSISGGAVRPDDAISLDRLRNTYGRIVTSDLLRRQLTEELGLETEPRVHVDLIPTTELMRITVEDDRPETPPRAADHLASLLVARVREITARDIEAADARFRTRVDELEREIQLIRREREELRSSGGSNDATAARIVELEADLRLQEETVVALREEHERNRLARAARADGLLVLEPAPPRAVRSGPARATIGALALFAGLVGGLGLAFLFENVSRRLHGKDEIEQAIQAPVLGAIPSVRGAQNGALFNSASAGEEAFRRLATNVLAVAASDGVRTILVTSATPGEGKSTVVANLARAIAEAGARVVVVDADLRRPRLHRIFRLPGDEGLATVAAGAPVEAVVQATSIPRLALLAGGESTSNPALLLRSPAVRTAIRQLEERFDAVLVDGPALLGVTDSLVLAPIVGGVLFVVRDDLARRETVGSACEQLARMHVDTLGVVLNGAHEFEGQRYYERLIEGAVRR